MWQEQDSSDDGARLKSSSIGLLHRFCLARGDTHANLGRKGLEMMSIDYTGSKNNLGFWIRGWRSCLLVERISRSFLESYRSREKEISAIYLLRRSDKRRGRWREEVIFPLGGDTSLIPLGRLRSFGKGAWNRKAGCS